MQRKTFLRSILGTSILATMEELSSIISTVKTSQNEVFVTFGAVHLNVTSFEKSMLFWRKIAGMKIRQSNNQWVALGSENNTLVVIHQAAEQPAKGKCGFTALSTCV